VFKAWNTADCGRELRFMSRDVCKNEINRAVSFTNRLFRWMVGVDIKYVVDSAGSCQKLSLPALCTLGASIPSFLIRDHSVDRFIPRSAAAPCGPPRTPSVRRSACKM
jgi:hypothetical protein